MNIPQITKILSSLIDLYAQILQFYCFLNRQPRNITFFHLWIDIWFYSCVLILGFDSEMNHEGGVGPDPMLFIYVVFEWNSLLLEGGTR